MGRETIFFGVVDCKTGVVDREIIFSGSGNDISRYEISIRADSFLSQPESFVIHRSLRVTGPQIQSGKLEGRHE